MRLLIPLLLLTPALIGCLGAGEADPPPPEGLPSADLEDLTAPGANEATTLEDGSRVFRFTGETQSQGASAPLFGAVDLDGPELIQEFAVDGRVGYVLVNVTFDPDEVVLEAELIDEDGRDHCLAYMGYRERACSAPVNASMERQTWSVEVSSGAPADPGTPFTLTITLAPRANLEARLGDPTEDVDANITFRTHVTSPEGAASIEPSLGVLPDGTILVQNGIHTLRSRDKGESWEDVSPPGVVETLDPMLRVDPWTQRVYVDHLYVACSDLAWSNDAGESWLRNPHACGGSGGDHQHLAVGPPLIPAITEPVVYYHFGSGQQLGVWTARSLDGGLTWHDTPVVGQGDGRLPSNSGWIEADREGNVYTPLYLCDSDGYVGVATSNDAGLSYSFTSVDEEPGPCLDPLQTTPSPGDRDRHHYSDAALAIDTAGTVYTAYDRPSGLKYAYSTDHGETWSEPARIDPPGMGARMHTSAVAGDPGKLAVLYRATPDTDKPSETTDGWAAWHMYVAFVTNADTPNPQVRTAMINDRTYPTHRGPISTPTGSPDRNLLDFGDVDVLPDGRLVAAYTHGCQGRCATLVESEEGIGTVAVLEEGPRLFSGQAPWATGTP